MCSRLPRRRCHMETASRLSIEGANVSGSGMNQNRRTGRGCHLTGDIWRGSESTNCETLHVWVEDLERGTNVRVTSAVESDIRPVWSQDGRYLAYVSGKLPRRSGTRILSIAAADGTGVVRKLPCPGEYCETHGLDAQRPAGQRARGAAQRCLDRAHRGRGSSATASRRTRQRARRANVPGRPMDRLCLRRIRSPGSVGSYQSSPLKHIVISGDGGDQPVWRADGAELFFIDPQGQLRSVSVRWSRDGSPTFGLPATLNVPPIGRGHWGTPVQRFS